MKIGIRKPSLKKMITARISPKRFVRHNLGLKVPRGWGWLTNPKKALYNRIYNRTTISIFLICWFDYESRVPKRRSLFLFYSRQYMGEIDFSIGVINGIYQALLLLSAELC